MVEEVFDFVGAYKALQPAADRTIVMARESAHRKIRAESDRNSGRIAKLTQFTFDIPMAENHEFAAWFEPIVRHKDASFSLDSDREDARIVSMLVLLDLVGSASHETAAYVLAAAFAGHRRAPGHGLLETRARDLLSQSTRDRGLRFSARMASGSWGDLSRRVAAIGTQFDSATTQAAVDAVARETKAAHARLVANFNGALEALTVENVRLAEEVDLLWWHLGRWSHLLNRPLAEVDTLALPMVIGCDVAAMVNVPPGPYGVLGIIERALGVGAREKQTVEETLKAIDAADSMALMKGTTHTDATTTLHSGLQLLGDDAMAQAFAGVFLKRTGLPATCELTRLEIARQAYYERLFIKTGWR